MKFLVTGGAGFIGHNVVQQLEALGHECFILDSVTDYNFIPGAELDYLYHERTKNIKADVCKIDLQNHKHVDNFFVNVATGVDAVIHLASLPRQKVVSANPVLGSDVMCTGLVNLLELTKKYNIPKFMYISSSMVYGDFDHQTKEDAVCNPIGQYGIMKLMGEWLVKDYTRRGCFDHIIIRPSAVYGECDVDDRVVSKFIISALRNDMLIVNGANEMLDFTHVSDVATGIVGALLSKNTTNKTYNLTKSHSYSLNEAAKLAVSIAGKGFVHVRDKDDDFPKRGTLDITAARADFNYNPTVDFEAGLKQYCKWVKESEFWKTRI